MEQAIFAITESRFLSLAVESVRKIVIARRRPSGSVIGPMSLLAGEIPCSVCDVPGLCMTMVPAGTLGRCVDSIEASRTSRPAAARRARQSAVDVRSGVANQFRYWAVKSRSTISAAVAKGDGHFKKLAQRNVHHVARWVGVLQRAVGMFDAIAGAEPNGSIER